MTQFSLQRLTRFLPDGIAYLAELTNLLISFEEEYSQAIGET